MPSSVHSQDQDQSMMDAAPQDQEQQFQQPEVEADELEMEEKRIVIVRPSQVPVFIYLKRMHCWLGFTQLPGATETAASFQFEGEGHTLGNALRFSIMKKCVFFLSFSHCWRWWADFFEAPKSNSAVIPFPIPRRIRWICGFRRLVCLSFYATLRLAF